MVVDHLLLTCKWEGRTIWNAAAAAADGDDDDDFDGDTVKGQLKDLRLQHVQQEPENLLLSSLIPIVTSSMEMKTMYRFPVACYW